MGLIDEFISDEQDPKVIEKILPKVQEYCTSNEEVKYIAVQKKLIAGFAPDCIVLTNKRIILIKPKIVNGMDFKDYSWMNVLDISIKEQMMSATITIKTTDGKSDSMGDIPKVQARTLYRFGQEMEEMKKEERRQRELEDKRAAAGGINIAMPGFAPPVAAPVPVADDPMEKLQKLKNMLDSGILTQEEFDAKKADILSKM